MVAAVLRYKWTILLITVLGTAAGAAAGMLMPARTDYEAEATLWVESASREAAQRGPIRQEELLQSLAWIELLRSFVVLDSVVLAEGLFVNPANPEHSKRFRPVALAEQFAPGTYRLRRGQEPESYTLEQVGGGIVERGALGGEIGVSIGLQWRPDPDSLPLDRPLDFTVVHPREASRELARSLQAQLNQNGNFLRIRYRGESPVRTAATVNAVADRFIEVAADLKRARVEELVSILDEQLQFAAENLRTAESELEGFRVETIAMPSDRSSPVTPGLEATRDPVFSNFFQMRVELEEIRRNRDRIRRAITGDPERGVAPEALEAIGPVQQSSELTRAISELTTKKAELRALLYRFTPDHPQVTQLAEEITKLERSTIPSLADGLLLELASRERELEERIAGASGELRQIPPRAIEEARLTRAVAIADNLYTTLQRRYEEARLAAVSSVPDLRILDPAVVPRRPSGNQTNEVLLLAFAASLGLGILGALLRDRTDPRLRYPDQVTHELGLTMLGAVPQLKRNRKGLLRPESSTQAQEAFRSLRLNLAYAYGTAGPLVVTVTSPGPGDGKSLLTSNLALYFAGLGHRTVVVDGDIRRGTLHHAFEIDRVPGLTDHLRGKVGEPVLRPTTHDNLWIIPSGSRIKDGPELLSSKGMRELMSGLRGEFDVVLVDSPPLGAGVDPFVLGTLTGNILLVLRTGSTNREMADAKLELLDRLPVRLLGAVLNGIPNTKEYRYYSYVSGYEAHDEVEHENTVALLGDGR